MDESEGAMLTLSFIDKSAWGDGPWSDEPDRAEWQSPAGRPCLALRNRMGVWCGYVAVDPGHPWHGANYDELPAEVHGGLTFGEPCMTDERPQHERVCHVPQPGEPDDVWWLGFDCGHGDDVCPAVEAEYVKAALGFRPIHTYGSSYKTLDYVRSECEQLAEQVVAAS